MPTYVERGHREAQLREELVKLLEQLTEDEDGCAESGHDRQAHEFRSKRLGVMMATEALGFTVGVVTTKYGECWGVSY